MAQIDDRKQVKLREARLAHFERVTNETIKKHIQRGPRVCCLDNSSLALPDYFVRCVDCIKPLDTDDDLC